jgi:hypothetical protein
VFTRGQPFVQGRKGVRGVPPLYGDKAAKQNQRHKHRVRDARALHLPADVTVPCPFREGSKRGTEDNELGETPCPRLSGAEGPCRERQGGSDKQGGDHDFLRFFVPYPS